MGGVLARPSILRIRVQSAEVRSSHRAGPTQTTSTHLNAQIGGGTGFLARSTTHDCDVPRRRVERAADPSSQRRQPGRRRSRVAPASRLHCLVLQEVRDDPDQVAQPFDMQRVTCVSGGCDPPLGPRRRRCSRRHTTPPGPCVRRPTLERSPLTRARAEAGERLTPAAATGRLPRRPSDKVLRTAEASAQAEESEMAALDLRVRLLGRALRRLSITRMDDEQIARMQQRQHAGHNAVLDAVFGGVAPGVGIADGTAAGAAGPVRIRSYRPAGAAGGPLPLVMDFHGGGWTFGPLEASDWLCSHVAAAVGALVVSVDYRLAPSHRWPAAAEDCYAALVDVVARADELGVDPGRVAVMGDSAGGNLAAVVSLMARDRSGPAIAQQSLLYPATDLTLSSPSIDENAHAPVLSRADCTAFRDHYLGGQDPRQPYASPLHAADHARLPRALVQVAEHDPIRDDGLRYAAALRDAGVPVRTTTYVGMPHGYLSFPRLCRSAPQALSELCTELSAALLPAAAPP
jgi:acetyl esterase/lipase